MAPEMEVSFRNADEADVEAMAYCISYPNPVGKQSRRKVENLDGFKLIIAGPPGSRAVIGWISYRKWPRREANPRHPAHIHVNRLFVIASAQGQKIGKKLLWLALNEAQNEQIRLRVQATLDAVPYFQKQGFGVDRFNTEITRRQDVLDLWYGHDERGPSPRDMSRPPAGNARTSSDRPRSAEQPRQTTPPGERSQAAE
ncbi:hypothetical protein EMMF5_006199 [Cystobasidiomycetes sp. EMM_F5]